MASVHDLLTANLHDVFGNRDAASRHSAVDAIYTDDVVFVDPEGTNTGRDAVEQKAAALLDEAPLDFGFTEDSISYTGVDTGALAWAFGPADHPVVRGIDIITVRDGRIASIRTLVVPVVG